MSWVNSYGDGMRTDAEIQEVIENNPLILQDIVRQKSSQQSIASPYQYSLTTKYDLQNQDPKIYSGKLTLVDTKSDGGYYQKIIWTGRFVICVSSVSGGVSGLFVYSISKAGIVTLTDSEVVDATEMVFDGQYIYTHENLNNFRVFELSEKGVLTEIAQTEATATKPLFFDGKYLYTISGSTIYSYSVSSGVVSAVDSIDVLSPFSEITSITGDGRHLYVGGRNGTTGCIGSILTEDGVMTYVSVLVLATYSSLVVGLSCDLDYIYAAGSGNQFLVICSASNSGAITYVGGVKVGTISPKNISQRFGDTIFLARDSGGISAIDISDPANPVEIEDAAGVWAYSVAVSNRFVFSAAYSSGLRVYTRDTGLKYDLGNQATRLTGGMIASVTTVNVATYDLLPGDYILDVTYTNTGAVTSLTLPTAQVIAGRIIYIKDGGLSAGTNNITIDTEGAETIDGAATAVISGDGNCLTLFCDGTNWKVL